MSSMSDTRTQKKRAPKPTPQRKPSRRNRSCGILTVAVVVAAVLAGLVAIFVQAQSAGPTDVATAGGGTDARFPYVVGDPGIGAAPPDFTLTSTSGDRVSLADFRGESVLLYFQEGLMCQPCWDQLKEIEGDRDAFTALGVDSIVSVTHDPIDALREKVELEGLQSPVVSDPGLSVSKTYGTNGYGMMGDSTNGHSFILVGPSGKIRWRADYGGEPKYTMYVPVDVLKADLEAALSDS